MLKADVEINSLLETVEQAKSFLFAISPENYQQVLTPHFASSAGAHMRHILDHYLALIEGLTNGVVNYNKRHRHSEVESCPKAALAGWEKVENWLNQLTTNCASLPIKVICETSVNETKNIHTSSTLGRELVFVSSHAVHHFSLMSVIRSLQGQHTDANFGIAPSTATYLREQA
ncbi:hypothetical protein [Paraglaciecola sp.]|uniref:hypothetical protein n=1 Tax=Paraglaciecola sp. TaxID=1920173 RepID=UPI003EF9C2E2